MSKDNWTEILGSEEIFKVLADASAQLTKSSPAFRAAIARRAPIVQKVASKRRDRAIEFELTGKAGETKTVSAGASKPDQLFLFRGEHLVATDTAKEPGTGTFITKFEIGKRDQWRQVVGWENGIPTTNFKRDRFTRGSLYDTLHPRAEVLFEVKFVEDCTWTANLLGTAVPVANEGVYAITPTVPCNAKMPDVVTDFEKTKPYDIRYSAAGTRCELCWFKYDQHASWPWRKFSHEISLENVDPGESIVTSLETPNLLYVDQANMTWHHSNNWAPLNGKNSYEVFRTNGFSVSGGQFTSDDSKFNYRIDSGLVVPARENLLFAVRNVSSEARSFKGTIEAMEMIN